MPGSTIQEHLSSEVGNSYTLAKGKLLETEEFSLKFSESGILHNDEDRTDQNKQRGHHYESGRKHRDSNLCLAAGFDDLILQPVALKHSHNTERLNQILSFALHAYQFKKLVHYGNLRQFSLNFFNDIPDRPVCRLPYRDMFADPAKLTGLLSG